MIPSPCKFIILYPHLFISFDEYIALVDFLSLKLNFLPRNDHYVLKVSFFELLSGINFFFLINFFNVVIWKPCV